MLGRGGARVGKEKKGGKWREGARGRKEKGTEERKRGGVKRDQEGVLATYL